MVSIISLSYAKRADRLEPNPCNIRIADETKRIIMERGDINFVVAQWEPARKLTADGFPPTLTVGPHDGKNPAYLDTDDVLDAAQALFDRYGEKEVVVVANPFLHLGLVCRKLRERGFTVINEPVRRIGSDPSLLNKQWWTMNPLLTLVYGVIVTVTGKHGIGERV